MTTQLFLSNLGFFVMGVLAVAGALIAVSQQNLLRAALGLILAFLGVAGIYFMLEAEFVGVVQILIYVGAISVLILFAVMLTRGLMQGRNSAHNTQWMAAAGIALLLFTILAAVSLGANWHIDASRTTVGDMIPKLGTELLTTYLLPFEAISLLLLAALVGAIVIAREENQ
ncbi:MAG: NADH-quinone oxidoreductase subunit J [Chloroflexi bacterium]|nr:NADH-quinone oxidoreductase subunit J [Chloroflexota bacterium]